jgi:hypothetical protein
MGSGGNAAGSPFLAPIVPMRETLYTLAALLKAGNYQNYG